MTSNLALNQNNGKANTTFLDSGLILCRSRKMLRSNDLTICLYGFKAINLKHVSHIFVAISPNLKSLPLYILVLQRYTVCNPVYPKDGWLEEKQREMLAMSFPTHSKEHFLSSGVIAQTIVTVIFLCEMPYRSIQETYWFHIGHYMTRISAVPKQKQESSSFQQERTVWRHWNFV